MARYMLVDAAQGVIVNAIEWDGRQPWQPPKGHTVHRSDEAWALGYVWDGSKPVNPNPPVVEPRPDHLKDPTFD